jgi:hypothetical protein
MGMISILSDPLELVYGIPLMLKVILILPLVAIFLTAGSILEAVRIWKNKNGTFCGRLLYSLVVLASLLFLWFLQYWNLLVFPF